MCNYGTETSLKLRRTIDNIVSSCKAEIICKNLHSLFVFFLPNNNDNGLSSKINQTKKDLDSYKIYAFD